MRLLNKLKNKIRTRNDRNFLKKKKRGSFLSRILGFKKSTKPTFWQLRGRKCKTCVCCEYLSYGRFRCGIKDNYYKPLNFCCDKYEPKKSRAL